MESQAWVNLRQILYLAVFILLVRVQEDFWGDLCELGSSPCCMGWGPRSPRGSTRDEVLAQGSIM